MLVENDGQSTGVGTILTKEYRGGRVLRVVDRLLGSNDTLAFKQPKAQYAWSRDVERSVLRTNAEDSRRGQSVVIVELERLLHRCCSDREVVNRGSCTKDMLDALVRIAPQLRTGTQRRRRRCGSPSGSKHFRPRWPQTALPIGTADDLQLGSRRRKRHYLAASTCTRT